MARKSYMSHKFSEVPRAEIQRSRFDRSHGYKTTFDSGYLVPVYVDEMLPGDSFRLNMSFLSRLATPIVPIMDNIYLTSFFFFVPNRLLWKNWERFMGDQPYPGASTDFLVPQQTAPAEGGWPVGSFEDYIGLPTGIKSVKADELVTRAYALIWNEWFRDENLQQPVVQDTDDANNTGSNTGTQLTDAQNGGLPLKAGKMHDYFTSCLPEPQKGEASAVPISIANMQVTTGASDNSYDSGNPLRWKGNVEGTNNVLAVHLGGNRNNETVAKEDTGTSTYPGYDLRPSNLIAYSNGAETNITINELRQAIAIQHILEADARGGTRYTELLKNEFGVTSPDSRLQRTEYIGGNRIPININQVIQQSATDQTSPQGNTAAYSLTTSRNKMMSYSATEHGYILGLAVIRVDHSYQQGLRRMWSRKRRFDFYHPMLANLGEMEVLNKEIYCQGKDEDDDVFGYQEAWADYRYHPNMVTGEMRSNYDQSLDAWHYADYYKKLPVLSSEWIQEGKENIDRTIAVQSEISHQFIANFYFDQTWTRPMPIYSIPGLEKI